MEVSCSQCPYSKCWKCPSLTLRHDYSLSRILQNTRMSSSTKIAAVTIGRFSFSWCIVLELFMYSAFSFTISLQLLLKTWTVKAYVYHYEQRHVFLKKNKQCRYISYLGVSTRTDFESEVNLFEFEDCCFKFRNFEAMTVYNSDKFSKCWRFGLTSASTIDFNNR